MEKELPTKTIAFVVMGSVDKTMVKRVMDFVAAELRCPLSSKKPITQPMTNSPATQAALLSRLITSKEACIVALVEEPNAAEAFHGYLDNNLKVGIVNVTALKPANAATPEGVELFGRRLEKETMRTVGHLIGMESCVEPHCALTPYPTLEVLDAMGRNYCPPCQQKAADRLKEALK
jgi:predicted Zn-dependent protease